MLAAKLKIQKLLVEFIESTTNPAALSSRTLFVRHNLSDIIQLTEFLPESAKVNERLYIIHHNLDECDLKCPMCEKKRKFYTFTSGYHNACSRSCSTAYQQKYLVDKVEAKRKMVETNSRKSPEEKKQTRIDWHNTMVKRYGENYASDFGKLGYENALARGTYLSGISIIRHSDSEKWKEMHAKAGRTLSNSIDENGNSHYDRIHLSKLRDIDEDGNNFYDRVRLNNYDNGTWTHPNDKPDLAMYRWYVQREMLKYKDEISNLHNFEKRGHANKGMYHLDHKFSIIEGFKQCVPPYIIGSIHNLEMITARNNLAKNRKCSITLDSLCEAYFAEL